MKRSRKLRNVNVDSELNVISPGELIAKYPLTKKARTTVENGRHELMNILLGSQPRRIVIATGPCSVHDFKAAIEFAERLVLLQKRVGKHILLIMRVYFEKPRTTTGWKGLIVDPNLNGSNDINAGLELARKILLAINELGVPVITEFLGPIVPQYISDLITTGTIGARTTESQTHREMASGLSMPIGYKNGTDGSVETALNAFISAQAPHSFLGVGMDSCLKIIKTKGNPNGYLVLRGGKSGKNFDQASVKSALEVITKKALDCKILVDCSHENSGKKHTDQNVAFRAVLDQIVAKQKNLVGMMLESNLNSGRQDVIINTPLKYGVSVTDECIGWEETERLILEAHRKLS